MKLNFTYKKWHSLLLLLFIFGISNQASAADYYIKTALSGTAVAPLTWNTASNWAIGGAVGTAATVVPTSSDNVFISAGKYVSIPLGVTGSCAILSVVGTTANLYIEGTALLNCTTININTGGNITMKPIAPSSNIITCSGTINCGTSGVTTAAGKGTLTVANGSAVSCGKLSMGGGSSTNASTIPGRTGSSTFTFTGNGSDVIPNITTGVNSSTPVFASVIFSAGVGNTITIPSGFCALVMGIASGTVDFENNYSTVFTGTSGSLTMDALTTLKIGGDKQIPNMASYTFNNSSTVNFSGSTQIIRGILSGYKNLTLSGAGLKSLGGEVTISLTLSIADGTILDLAGNNLTLSGNYVNGTIVEGTYTKSTGCIRSSSASDIWYRGYSNSAMQFDQTTPGTTNVVKNINLGDIPTNLGATTPTEINPLNLIIENPLNITGTVNFTAGHLVSNGNVTFKSNSATTAFVGPITDTSICGIIGDVTVERFIPASNRAYRPLSSSVTGGTIFSNWQEGGSTNYITGTITAGILTTTNSPLIVTRPLAVGMRISGTGIPAHTTIASITDPTHFTLVTTQNDAINRKYKAYATTSSTTAQATFTGRVTNNVLTVSNLTGTPLAIGQKITGTLPAVANTVILGGSGTTWTIGVQASTFNVASGTIYYNGAAAGLGTHITGLAGSATLLGQESSSGLDYTLSGNPSMYSYNNNDNAIGWSSISNTKTTSLTAGKPYIMMIRGDRTIDLALNSTTPTATTLRSTGTIVAGDVTIPTADVNNLSGLNTTTASFNYVGNPYQAPVDLSLIYNNGDNVRWADLGTTYTVFDPSLSTRGAYVTWDFSLGSTNSSSAISETLQPNQAFFVTTQGPSPTLVFNEADKNLTTNAVTMFRKAQTKNTNSLIRGAIFNSAEPTKGLDGFILAFSDNYDNGIVAEDTKKPTGNEDETIASKNGASVMVIDKRNFPATNDEIPLDISKYRSTDYTLKFDVSNFDAKDAYLRDAYTAKETQLKNNQINSYAFKVDATPASAAADRFSIVFKAATALSTISNSINKFTVYPNPVVDNKFTVRTNQDLSGKKASLNIVNTLGQKVFSTNTTFSNEGTIAVNPTNALSKGIYFLKVAVDGKVETKKLIIK